MPHYPTVEPKPLATFPQLLQDAGALIVLVADAAILIWASDLIVKIVGGA